ncbi:MAG: hypothetical protein OXC67_03080 [Flavobacteriaceae bacterium]|nr:hypothetical protein [Flavobacteriaceae bacterium]MCY4299599.1 hypothetical protein [Flavobacteriaceae bacterium]
MGDRLYEPTQEWGSMLFQQSQCLFGFEQRLVFDDLTKTSYDGKELEYLLRMGRA